MSSSVYSAASERVRSGHEALGKQPRKYEHGINVSGNNSHGLRNTCNYDGLN